MRLCGIERFVLDPSAVTFCRNGSASPDTFCTDGAAHAHIRLPVAVPVDAIL